MDILILAGSTRSASLNMELGRYLAAVLVNSGKDARFADLADFEMPIYNGDDEVANGIPPGAVALHDLMQSARSIVIVSPEYNGGPTPVLKNAIDWVSRVSKRPLSGKRMALASATPGQGGGLRGLKSMRLILTSMRANVSDLDLSVGDARSRLASRDPALESEALAFLDDLTRVPTSAG